MLGSDRPSKKPRGSPFKFRATCHFPTYPCTYSFCTFPGSSWKLLYTELFQRVVRSIPQPGEQALRRGAGCLPHIYIGVMEKKMETTVVYWGYIGIMEKNMETTIVYWGYIGKVHCLLMFAHSCIPVTYDMFEVHGARMSLCWMA